jgi:PAS domain S-box-containing protein
MSNSPPMTEFNIDDIANYKASSLESYLSIDFTQYIHDLMQTISVFGAGIALLKHGKLDMVAGSSANICAINPHNFYTEQTVKNAQSTEMMMPFGSFKEYAQSASNENDIHYYYGVPLVVSADKCVGCLFMLNSEAESLSDKDKISIQLMAQLLESKMALANAHHVYQEALNFQTMIVNNSDNFIFVKNHKFEIVFANNAFLGVYPAAQRDKVIGYTTVEEYEPAEVELFLANDKTAFLHGVHQCFETIAFPNGEIRTVETTKTRFSHGDEIFILGICVDVTEQQHLAQQIEAKQIELSQFADLATHDMRKPINNIHQLVDYIIEDNEMNFDNTTHSQLDEIKSRCLSMSSFLSDMYEYAQIGQEKVSPSAFNSKSLVEDIVYLLDIPSDININMTDVDITLPQVPVKMILLQLLTNAVNHYGAIKRSCGEISVDVKVLKHGVSMTVSDDGQGMNDLLQKNAFVLFNHANRNQHVKGSGKGLPMVKKLVEQYRGTVSLTSRLNEGTSVTVFWPN